MSEAELHAAAVSAARTSVGLGLRRGEPRTALEKVETVVIGAGQAGLSASYHLSRLGCDHVVLERGRVGERWRSERWDGFVLNTPNWA